MKLALRNTRQAWAGLFFVAVGVCTFFGALQYPFGTLTHMGPSVFPIFLSLLLTGIGIAAIAQSLARSNDGDEVPHINLVPIAFLMAGVVAFGLLVERAGLIAAIFALIIFCCYERLRTRPIEVIVIAACVSALSALLFVRLLQLPFTLF